MIDNKCISIVIPTIGRSSLFNAVKSAQDQIGGLLLEIIISLDGKYRDVSLVLPEQIRSVPYRVVIADGGGVADTLNFAIKSAKGKLISWLSDDDLYSPIKILAQHNAVRKKLGSTYKVDNIFAVSAFSICELESNQTTKHDPSDFVNLFQDPSYIALAYGFVSGCTALFSKKLWQITGGFDPRFRTTQDYIFWKKIIDRQPDFVFSAYAGIVTNVHDGMESRKLSVIHDRERDSLLKFIFNGLLAQRQASNLTLAEQRIMYFLPPSHQALFAPISTLSKSSITELCELELQLLKVCILFLPENNINQTYAKATDAAQLIGSKIREKVLDIATKVGQNIPDADIAQFVDAYHCDGSSIQRVCGFIKDDWIFERRAGGSIIYSALMEYRYVITVSGDLDFNSKSFRTFLENVQDFENSENLSWAYITLGSAMQLEPKEKYGMYVRNPFLANESVLNAAN